MMIRLPDFNMLSDTSGTARLKNSSSLDESAVEFMMRYPGALLARYHRSDFAARHRTGR
ncbi:hypothetical protein ACNKHV_20490 [Shigella flexneri]